MQRPGNVSFEPPVSGEVNHHVLYLISRYDCKRVYTRALSTPLSPATILSAPLGSSARAINSSAQGVTPSTHLSSSVQAATPLSSSAQAATPLSRALSSSAQAVTSLSTPRNDIQENMPIETFTDP